MSKTISINPDLFKIPSYNSGTRKRKETDPNAPKIKVKVPKEKNKTTKRSILKFIRNHQERNYRKLMDENVIPPIYTPKKPNESYNFNSEFDESLKYLMDVAKENELNSKKITSQNTTLKNHPYLSSNIYENVSLQFPSDFDNKPIVPVVLNTMNVLSNNIPPINLRQQPIYGCLKGGILPTYRQIHNKTIRNNRDSIIPSLPHSNLPMLTGGNPIHSPTIRPLGGVETQISSQNKHDILTKQMQETKYKLKHQPKLRYPKQKKTLRRTFKIGKSKIYPKVSVLISNRTIRNNITTKAQQLKQTSIQEVQRYLLKHGFIKVGSSAPNDVLRKMYESAVMICGEVHNHNLDNLLYNYFHDDLEK